MLPHSVISLVAQATASRRLVRWLYRLGGVGLIPLGMLDNSVVPITGSMDFVTILLCANHRDFWPYYVIMATLGAVAGGYLTYRLASGEAKGKLGKIISSKRFRWMKSQLEKWGVGSIAVPAVLPPPFPMVPFLIAAGASQYPRGKFLAALAVGRAVRYTILGALGYVYGRWIITAARQHIYVVVAIGCAMLLISATVAFIRFRHESAYAR
jgi:membrane protein YqaA with SNARE-associated domain